MKYIRKNQIIVYTLALMLVTAGYLNYTGNISKTSVETSSQEISQDNISDETNVDNQGEKTAENDEENQEKSEASKESEEEESEDEKLAAIGDATLVSSNDVVTDYYAKSKLERDSMYSQMIETYEKILNSSNSLETQKQSATQEITRINELKNKIMICENLIKTKGFENCLIFVNDGSVNAIIGASSLKKEEIAQIQNIITRELNAEIENIHISTK